MQGNLIPFFLFFPQRNTHTQTHIHGIDSLPLRLSGSKVSILPAIYTSNIFMCHVVIITALSLQCWLIMNKTINIAVWLRKLRQGLCINLERWDGKGDGREVLEGGDIYITMADSS